MKFKYFLRGLGTGIVFSAIICLVAFQSSKSSNISDKEVIERAKALGMIEKQESLEETLLSEKNTTKKNQDKNNEENKKENKKTEEQSADIADLKHTTEQKRTEKTETSTEHQDKSEEDKEQTTEQPTTQQEDTEPKTEQSTTQQADEEPKTEQPTTQQEEKQTVTITIKGGSTSYPVCQKLQELGVIKDATDFDNYLIKNGYANRISVGTHTLTIGMTYEEIAIAISDPR